MPIAKKNMFTFKNTISSKLANIMDVVSYPEVLCTVINIADPDQNAMQFPKALSKAFPRFSQM
jgi:hypothetical protein